MSYDLDKTDILRDSLEQQELLSPNGVAPIDVYKQLLLIYLIDSDTVNAKFLWKRIPGKFKNENLELQNIWKVGQLLWKRDFENVFTVLSKNDWTVSLEPLLSKLTERLRMRLLDLVGRAYSNMKLEKLCLMIGLDENETIELVRNKSWHIDMDCKLVKPTNQSFTAIEHSETSGANSDKLMSNLTDYISFLEN